MNNKSIAPCGVICDLCLGFQRNKNKCAGCISTGNKPNHCTICSIKTCPEKNGNEKLLCNTCNKFPCKRIINLDKRYITKYGESPIQNLIAVTQVGLSSFIKSAKEKWACTNCGNFICVHRNDCLACGSQNPYFPVEKIKN